MGNAIGGEPVTTTELEKSNAEISAFNKKGLNEETLAHIFQYLSADEVGRLGRVCKTWRRISRSAAVWKGFCTEAATEEQTLTFERQDVAWFVDWYSFYVKNFAFVSSIRWEEGKQTYSGQCLINDERHKVRDGPVSCAQCGYSRNVDRTSCLKCSGELPLDSILLQVPIQIQLTLFASQSRFKLHYDTSHCSVSNRIPRVTDATFPVIRYAMVAEGSYLVKGASQYMFDVENARGYCSGRRSKSSFTSTRRASPRGWFSECVPSVVKRELRFQAVSSSQGALECSGLSFLLFGQCGDNTWFLVDQNTEQLLTEPISVAEMWTSCRLSRKAVK